MSDLVLVENPNLEWFKKDPTHLIEHFSSLSLLKVKGKKKEPLFVSVLLHGNEWSGYRALQRLLKKYEGRELPRSLIIQLGNLEAAQENKRFLSSQLDHNRIWDGGASPRQQKAQKILNFLSEQELFAGVDLHNTSGKNPFYAAVNTMEKESLILAGLFSPHLVYFEEPRSACSLALAKFCPAMTVEAGQSEEEAGIQRSYEFLDQLLRLDSLEEKTSVMAQIDVYESFGRLRIPEGCSFVFRSEEEESDLSIRGDLENLNFTNIKVGTPLGSYFSDKRLEILDPSGRDISDEFLKYDQDGQITVTQAFVPSMLTTNEEIVRQDILGYLMRRKEIS